MDLRPILKVVIPKSMIMWRSLGTAFNCFNIIWSVLAIEFTLKWNSIDKVYELASTGQNLNVSVHNFAKEILLDEYKTSENLRQELLEDQRDANTEQPTSVRTTVLTTHSRNNWKTNEIPIWSGLTSIGFNIAIVKKT